MKLKIFGLTTILLTILGAAGFRFNEDPTFLQNLKLRLDSYNRAFPEEKIYIKLDKPFYKPGETIWFNAFALNGTTHAPTQTSDVLYVHLIDPKGNAAMTRELLIRRGTAHGAFTLPEDAAGGLYEVRAFTRWIQNFGDSVTFSKKIQVQKVITPRLLLKLDFERKAYGASDSVHATLEVRNLKDEPATGADVKLLINLGGERYQSKAVECDSRGNAKIHFMLPDSLKTSDGLLQALVTHRGITESISRSIPIVLNKIDIRFFPEGGYTLADAESRVAFKSVNEFGKGADVEGVIVDESDSVVGSFKSFHMGMGAFSFKPAAGKKYFALLKGSFGNKTRFELPTPQPSGFQLNLAELTDESVLWNIHASKAGVGYLVAQSHGTIQQTRTLRLSKGKNTVSLPLTDFPSGISVFTLFDGEGQARCERLVYINSKDRLNISLSTPKKQYLPGENVELTIRTSDASGQPKPARLSLSVVDDQLVSFADDRQDNLLSYMLLSSEVKGKIEEPSFYFDPDEPRAALALDYLLMTQGWRRFTWKDVFGHNSAISYLPEKITTIDGRLTNKSGEPVIDEVTLIEMGNLKRILTVRTGGDGRFTFQNTDPTIPIMLLSSRNTRIDLDKSEVVKPAFSVSNVLDQVPVPEEIAVEAKSDPVVDEGEAAPFGEDTNLDFSLNADVAQLSEVVVIGYGTTEKKHLGASVVTVYREEINSLPSFEYALQGKVAGISIRMPNSPGAASVLRVRGISSLANNSGEPLYVIDGHPVSPSLNANFSIASAINPNEVETIHVLKSPEADALFGSDAANGAILITTRSRLNWGYSPFRKHQGKYVHTIVSPRIFSPVKEFYQEQDTFRHGVRKDLNSTVYWNPDIQTNEKGIAKISFRNNDQISTFRMNAEGFSPDGSLGSGEETYFSLLPFSVDAKIPEYLGFEDVLKLPVQIKNETTKVLSASITLRLPAGIRAGESTLQKLDVPAGSVSTFTYTLTPAGIQGTFPLTIVVDAENRRDVLESHIKVRPTGFPMRLSFSGQERDRQISFNIRDAEKGTIEGNFSAYPDILSDLMTGVEAIFQEPYGCFEQTSSSTFPNILALQYLKNSGTINPEVEARAMKYIRDGYKRLISFEVKGGGFDWFGNPPAHEALTAYGLIEFIEMKKVYPEVDDRMIARTRDWLLSRRTGNGTYKLHLVGLDDFSRPSEDVSNAYITFALSETGTSDLETEYRYTLESGWKNEDMYQLALAANIAFNLNKNSDYEKLIYHFEKAVDVNGLDNMTASHSVVRSQGHSLTNETIALWAIALIKSGKSRLPLVKRCIDHLISKRSFGKFGSTQATVLSLKALAEYANLIQSASHSGEIQLLVNGVETDRQTYQKSARNTIELTGFSTSFSSNGEQRMSIRFLQTPEALPYSVNVEWYTQKPTSSKECKVQVTTSLAERVVPLNETVRLSVRLRNNTSEGVPMTMAIIGIPAGLSAQPWQLKELQEKGAFDFYEIAEGKLMLYYRQMKPREEREVSLDLKAELRGSFQGSASTAYLYYTDEFKHWEEGITVTVD